MEARRFPFPRWLRCGCTRAVSNACTRRPEVGGSAERVMLAPAWLVAMENGLGHKGKHWVYVRHVDCL